MPNKGGKGSRRRRRQARRRARKASPYGPVIKMPLKYVGRFTLTKHDLGGTFFSTHVPFGNKQLFSTDFSAMLVFHEYKLMSANIKITWTLYKTKEWQLNSHPELISATVCSFLRDQESPASKVEKIPFDTVFATYGGKVSHLAPASKATTFHRWIPTEPTDRDWRLTTDDGLCHIYLCWQTDDLIDSKHQCTAIIEVTTEVHLRAMTIGAGISAPSELSPQDLFHQEQRDQLQTSVTEQVTDDESLSIIDDVEAGISALTIKTGNECL